MVCNPLNVCCLALIHLQGQCPIAALRALLKPLPQPAPSSIDYFVDKGMNTFRIPFQLERLAPPATGLTGALDATYLAALKTVSLVWIPIGSFANIHFRPWTISRGKELTQRLNLITLVSISPSL